MPTYQITAPNGKTYRIEGPEGATDEQIRAEVLRQFPDADPTVQTNPMVRTPPIQDDPIQAARDSTQQGRAAADNAVAGLVQGAGAALYDFPMDVAGGVSKGINYALTEGGGAVLNALGADGIANALRTAGQESRAAFGPNSLAGLRVADTIEAISPTPEGMGAARFTAQVLGGAAVPLGPKAPRPIKAPVATPTTEAGKVIEAGKEAGVRVMTSDVKPPKTFVGKTARAIGERVPFAGTGGPRMAQQEERVEAVKNLARDFGVDGSQEFLEEVTDDLAKTRGGTIAKFKAAKDAVIQGVTAPFRQSPKAVAEIDKQIARLKGIDAKEYAPVIERLERFKTNLTEGKTLEQVEGNRKLLGDLFADPSLASIKGEGQKAVNAIYAPLRDDMGEFIKQNAGNEAFSKWQGANKRLADMAGELSAANFKGVLNKAETTPEDVAKLLFSKKPSDVRRLMGNLSPAGKEKAKAAVIHEAITKAGGIENVSPQQFANALERFGRTTGIIFQGEAPRIEGLVRLLKATQQASVAAAAPPTGAQNSVPILAAVLADWMGTAGGAITAGAMGGFAARAYESAPVRNMLVSLSKTKPGSPAEGALLERIGKTLISQVELQTGRAAANDNARLVSEVAADPDKQQ